MANNFQTGLNALAGLNSFNSQQNRAQLKNWTWYDFNDYHVGLVPPVSGVYALGVSNTIIYIGSSNNLNHRLQEHQVTSDFCIGRAKQFAIDPCADYKTQEQARLRDHIARFGKFPTCNDRL